MFKGKDQTDNLQDLMYSLAVQELFPEYSNRISEFLFLKFDLDPNAAKSGVVRMKPLDSDELEGFELQLTEIQKYLDNFSEKTLNTISQPIKAFQKTTLLAANFCVALRLKKEN